MKSLVIPILATAFTFAHAEPKIATVAQVGNPDGTGGHYVFLMLQFLDGAVPAASYSVHQKSGGAGSAAPYSQVAVLAPTTNVLAIASLLDRADAAGFDNAALAAALDDILPVVAADPLPAKLAAFFTATLPGGYDEVQKQAIARLHPQVLTALGQAAIVRAPAGQSTFEIRSGGTVVGRSTVGGSPAILPAPRGLSERVETTARGDLRALLRWCFPEDLRRRALHWSGFKLYRVGHAGWQAAFGGVDPPANISRALLLTAIDQGLALQVNALPVAPGVELPCPPQPNSDVYYVADDRDSVAEGNAFEGAPPFEDGFRCTYYVAACDHFGRIGQPSPGLDVTICDRLPPVAPKDLRADHERDAGTDFFALSWDRDPVDEVRRYRVYSFPTHDGLYTERNLPSWPNSPNLVAVVDNAPGPQRIRYLDPAGGADGITRWYYVVPEDDTACKNGDIGNLGGAAGPVPIAPYDLDGPPPPTGRVRGQCCNLFVEQSESGGAGGIYTATRNSDRITWVEFRDGASETFFGHYEFGATDTVAITADLASLAPDISSILPQARFGTNVGVVSDWMGNFLSSVTAPLNFTWDGEWDCQIRGLPCPGGGIIDVVDPETGDLVPPCFDLEAGSGGEQYALYRRVGAGGNLVMLVRGRFDGANSVEVCDPAPVALPGKVWYSFQVFDGNGNPSAVVPLGCFEMTGTEGLPKPRITNFDPLDFFLPTGPTADVVLNWFCPLPGVERFEIEVTADGEAPLSVLTNRLANGFGNGTTAFAHGLVLKRGLPAVARVRALAGSLAGDWSDPEDIAWLYDPPVPPVGPCPIPWPALDPAPLVIPPREINAEFVEREEIVNFEPSHTEEMWIDVGIFPDDAQIFFASTEPPQISGIDGLEDVLRLPLPFTVYLYQTAAESRGTMLQVSHYVDEILTDPEDGSPFDLVDPAFGIKRLGTSNRGSYHLWFRVRQPLIDGRTYRCALVFHGADREPIQTLRTEEITASPIP